MALVVVIPEDYEELSRAQRDQIIPICIQAFDRAGRPIAPEWFSRGVAPVHNRLVRIANHTMGDPWCVSELAEATVHRLWAKHGDALGSRPARRVLKMAMWLGKELNIGDWRKKRHPNLYLALDALDEKLRDQALAEPIRYVELFERQIMLDSVEERLRKEGRTDMLTLFQLIRRGYSWQEVAVQVGARSSECVKRRFYRWARKAARV